MMKTTLKAVLWAVLTQGLLSADQVYAKVNGEALGDTDLKPMLKLFHATKPFDELTRDEWEMILDQSIERKLIIQNARKEKLDESARFQEILKAFKERLLVEMWMQQKMDQIRVEEADLKTYFEKHKAEFGADAKFEDFKSQLSEKVKMEKFQILIDETLSNMKKSAKIEFTGKTVLQYR